MTRRVALLLLVPIILGGVALRSYHLTTRSIWFDEAFTWRLAESPVSEVINRTAADVHPPLYYLLLKAWIWIFRSSLLAMRSLSVVMAAVTIAAAYLFAASAWQYRRVGILAATLTAVSAWQIPFAWDVRMYTLGTSLVLLSSWMVLRQVRASLKRKSLAPTPLLGWVAYSALAVALIYVHNFGFLTLAAHLLFVGGALLVHTRARLYELIREPLARHALLAFALILLLYLPWLPVLIQQTSRLQENYWVPELSFASVADTFYHFALPTFRLPPPGGGLAALILTLAGFWWLVTKEKKVWDAAWLTTTAATLPIALTIAVSVVSQSLYQDRFLVFAHVFLVVGLSALIARLRSRRLVGTLSGLAVAFSIFAFVRYWQELRIPDRPGVRAAVSIVADNLQAEEVFVSSPYVFFPVVFYAEKQPTPFSLKLISFSSELPHFAGVAAIQEHELVLLETVTAPSAHSLWIIDTTGFSSVETQLPSPWHRATREAFAEVFPYQGEVIVSHWQR